MLLLSFRLTRMSFQQAKIEAIKQERESMAEAMLRTQFKMEMIVYSQDNTYSNSLSDRKKEEKEQQKGSKNQIDRIDNFATLQQLMLHLQSYYTVS